MRISSIKTHKDHDESRGYLIPINFSELDFKPKRIFIVNNVPPDSIRGNHAHWKTRQLLICTQGNVEVTLNDREIIETHLLTKGKSIIIPTLCWGTQKFGSIDSEIVVLCSTEYDAADYITDYDKFNSMPIYKQTTH